jgi:hypothetical protein
MFFTVAGSLALATSPTVPARYVPEAHDGITPLVRKSSTVLFEADFSRPAVQWLQAGERGRMPVGWKNFTTSSEVQGSFSRVVLDGKPVFRIEAKKTSAGEGSLRVGIPLGTLQPEVPHLIRARFDSLARSWVRLFIVPEGGGKAPKPLWHEVIKYVGPEGKLSEFSFAVPSGVGPVNLIVGLERAGECNVIDLTVERLGLDTLDTLLSTSKPELSVNVLRSTRFPLGLPTRWYLDRSTSEDERPIKADPSVPGPSGTPSLLISPAPKRAANQAPPDAVTIFGEPFAIARYWEPQIASLFVKGEASVQVSVHSKSTTVAKQTFTIRNNDGWKRIGMSFKPRALSDKYYLQFAVAGELWMDGLRVASGKINEPESFAYTPSIRAEVTLASPSPARVTFADSPSDAPDRRIDWAVLPPAGGFAAGSILRAKIINLYGQQIELPNTPLPEKNASVRGHWILPDFPDKPFGAHRVEAWVENASGERTSSVDELVIYRLPRPHYWSRDGENSYFGIHVTASARHLQMLKSVGVNWVRLHDAGIQYIGWHFLERERGNWTWEDAAIRRYRDHHLMILGQFGTAPAWASALGRVGRNSWLDRYYMPEDMDAWKNYVQTITKRYQNDIHYWDVWNEPWSVAFGKADAKVGADGRYEYLFGKNPPAEFANLTRVTVASARSIDPGAKIVGLNSDTGGTSQGTAFSATTVPARRYPGEDWTRLVAAAGGLDGVDIIGYHHYQNGPINVIGYEGDWVEIGNKRATGSLKKPDTGQSPLPVWMKEGTSVQSLTGRGFYYHSEPFPDGEDRGHTVSDHLLRYITTILSTGVEKTFLYSSHKYGFVDDGVRFRALLSEDGYLHPSAVAYAALANRIDGRPFLKAIQITPETRAYVFGDQSDGKIRDWTAVLIPKTFATSSTITLGNRGPLQVDDIFGNPVPLDASAPKGVFFVSGLGVFSNERLDCLMTSNR